MADEVSTNEIMEFLREHMVTKADFDTGLAKQKAEILDEIDEKLMDLKGDLTLLMRKEDKKLVSLIGLLYKKQVIDEQESKTLLEMEPFAK
jgi:hypothetical protein